MTRTTIYDSMLIPFPCEGGCKIEEVEISITFDITPGEMRTHDYPGCPPKAEEVETKVKFPDGKWLRLLGTIEDLMDTDKSQDFRWKAIEQAGEEELDAKMFAAETRWESRKDC